MNSFPLQYIFSNRTVLFALCLKASFLAVSALHANDWPNWRGPHFDGSAPDDFSYPEKFDQRKGVLWSYPLNGACASTPIVLGERVFLSGVSSESESSASLLAICLDRESGKPLWIRKAGSGYQPGEGSADGSPIRLDSRSNYASPSPVASSRGVAFFFGNGDLVCYALNGMQKWRRNVQEDFGDFCFQWTFSASPTLLSGKLFLPVLQRDEPVHGRGVQGADSYLICMDFDTGKVLWKHKRPTTARKESRESFATIIPYQGKLLVAGGDFLTCHDAADGAELWRWGTWNPNHREEWWRLVPSPVVGNDRVLVCAPKNAPVYAVQVNQESPPELAWHSAGIRELTSDVPTPLFYKDCFFLLSDLQKCLTKLSPSDGRVFWTINLPGKYKWRSSPTAADDKLFLMNHNAEVLVVDSKNGKVLHSVKMGGDYDDQTRSSIALSRGQLFIRTNEKLYCIE